jgi:hypothetical protein
MSVKTFLLPNSLIPPAWVAFWPRYMLMVGLALAWYMAMLRDDLWLSQDLASRTVAVGPVTVGLGDPGEPEGVDPKRSFARQAKLVFLLAYCVVSVLFVAATITAYGTSSSSPGLTRATRDPPAMAPG